MLAKNTIIKAGCVVVICFTLIKCHTSDVMLSMTSEAEIKDIIKIWRQQYGIEPTQFSNPSFWDPLSYGFNCKWAALANTTRKSLLQEYGCAAIPFLLDEIAKIDSEKLSYTETQVYIGEIIMEIAKIEAQSNKPSSQEVIACIKELLSSNKFTSSSLIQSACIKALVIMKTPDLEQFLKGIKNINKRHLLLGLVMLGDETAKKEYFDIIFDRYNSLILEKIKRKETHDIKFSVLEDIMNDMIDLGSIAYYTGDRRVLFIYVKIWQDYMELEDVGAMKKLASAILNYALFQLVDYETPIPLHPRCGTSLPPLHSNKLSALWLCYREFISWYNKHKNNLFWSKEKQKFVVLEGDDIIKWICEQEIKPPVSEEKEEIQKLYQQLTSKEPQIREDATQRLIEMGKKVVPIIKEGLNSDNLELKVRVKHILTEIATRGE